MAKVEREEGKSRSFFVSLFHLRSASPSKGDLTCNVREIQSAPRTV